MAVVVRDPKAGVTALVKECKACNAPIYFGFTENGKRNPYDVVDGKATRVSHFTSCPNVRQFEKGRAS